MLNYKEGPVGALGHGQLAMMSAEAGNEMGIPVIALGPGEKSPASHAASVIDGDFNNPQDVRRLGEQVGSFILDTDHVQTQVLKELRDEGLLIVPNPDVTYTIQNRIRLKSSLNDAGVRTADWFPVLSQRELLSAFDSLGQDVIVKTAEQGFDGRGNRAVSSMKDLEGAWNDFNGQEMIVEKRLDIEKEVAMMIARGMDGSMAMYPLVESIHRDGILEYTFLPAMVDEEVEAQAQEMGNLILDAFEGPALLGVEFIKPKDSPLVTNEIAGRPHNTGHYSIEACETSQFANLVKVARGEGVGQPTLLRPDQMVLMHNLNFGWDKEEFTEEDQDIVRGFGGTLHDYYKSPRPGSPRKRGHLTLFGENRQSLMANAQAAMKAMNYFGK